MTKRVMDFGRAAALLSALLAAVVSAKIAQFFFRVSQRWGV